MPDYQTTDGTPLYLPPDQRLIDGALASALATAQGAFPAIARDKEVTVTTKSGGSYKFKYAPLDSILNAVRKPLADNGLAITQLLDEGDLVTTLLHKDGGTLTGRLPIPAVDGVQAFGSAVTYLRRYSLQAILGIAAEEDDDGNHAAGNDAKFGGPAEPLPSRTDAEGLIGTAIAQGTQDFGLRQSPDGWTLPFRVKNGSKSFVVLAEDRLAEALSVIKERVLNQRVTVWGHWTDETIPAKGTKPQINYRVLHLERIETPDGTLPPVEAHNAAAIAEIMDSLPDEAPTAPLFTGPEFDDPPRPADAHTLSNAP